MKDVDNRRFRELLTYLKANRIVRNNQDFVERVELDRASVSSVVNDRINMPRNWPDRIAATFKFINPHWLRGLEEEEMIIEEKQEEINSQVEDNNNCQNGRNSVYRTLPKPVDMPRPTSAGHNTETMNKLLDNITKQNQMLAETLEANRGLTKVNADLMVANAKLQADNIKLRVEMERLVAELSQLKSTPQ